jgi:protease I
MDLAGKTVALLLEDVYQEMEFWYPLYRLREAGAKVVVVAPEAREYKSKLGYPARAERAAAEARAAEFDAVVIPGGYAPDKMRANAEMVRLTREVGGAGKPVAAICHAGWMLCSAGLLKGRTATSTHSIRDDMRAHGAEWVDREVVVDGNIITSREPKDLPAFMREVLRALGAK